MKNRVIDKRLIALFKQHKQLLEAYVDDAISQENERLQAAQNWDASLRVQGRVQMLKQFMRDLSEEPHTGN